MIRYFLLSMLIFGAFQPFFAMDKEQPQKHLVKRDTHIIIEREQPTVESHTKKYHNNKKNLYIKIAVVCAINVIGSSINFVVNQGLLIQPISPHKPSTIPGACQIFCYPCKSAPQCCKEYCPPRSHEPTGFGMLSFMHMLASSVGLIRSVQLAYSHHSDEQKELKTSTVSSNDDTL